LKYALDSGIIDIPHIEELIQMNQRRELLEKHPYKIWQGKDKKWYTYLPSNESGRILKKRITQKAIENDIIEYWQSKLDNPTINEVFDEWNNRRLELKKISNSTHLRNIQTFKRYYNEFGKRKIKSVSEEEFAEFIEEQIPKFELTAKAFSNLKTVTRGFLKRAKKRKLIVFDVENFFHDLDTSDTDFKKIIKEDYQEVFNEDETQKIMKYLIDNLDNKNIGILLMFITGIRVGELVTLKHKDFNGNTFDIRRTETRYMIEQGKYEYAVKEFPKSLAGARTVIVPEAYSWIISKIKRINPFSEYIFLKANGERMSTNCIRKRLYYICKKLNVYNKSPHKIRKTYGSILLDNHIDKQLIMGQMGHADILCTETHYHRNRRNIEKKSEILSSIPEFQQVVK